jgi:Neuraminidase (sialidase)
LDFSGHDFVIKFVCELRRKAGRNLEATEIFPKQTVAGVSSFPAAVAVVQKVEIFFRPELYGSRGLVKIRQAGRFAPAEKVSEIVV